MRASVFQRSHGRAESGATAAEFALVLPLLLLFILGIIDAGHVMWTWNQAEKATQMGARMAVVTDMVPEDLYTKDFSADLGQGQVVPTSEFSSTTCDSTSCTGDWGYDAAAFQAIVDPDAVLSADANAGKRRNRLYQQRSGIFRRPERSGCRPNSDRPDRRHVISTTCRNAIRCLPRNAGIQHRADAGRRRRRSVQLR